MKRRRFRRRGDEGSGGEEKKVQGCGRKRFRMGGKEVEEWGEESSGVGRKRFRGGEKKVKERGEEGLGVGVKKAQEEGRRRFRRREEGGTFRRAE